MGHEAIHILQGDHANNRMPKTVFGHLKNFIRSQDHPLASDTLMTEFMSGRKKISARFNDAASDIQNHMQGSEIQARLHQIMMDGYQRWGRVPQNRDELWAAMKNAGVKPPPEIAQHLSSLPENAGARHFLSCKKGGIADKVIGTASEI